MNKPDRLEAIKKRSSRFSMRKWEFKNIERKMGEIISWNYKWGNNWTSDHFFLSCAFHDIQYLIKELEDYQDVSQTAYKMIKTLEEENRKLKRDNALMNYQITMNWES